MEGALLTKHLTLLNKTNPCRLGQLEAFMGTPGPGAQGFSSFLLWDLRLF